MERVKQYHTHVHIVNAYKLLSIPVSTGIKFYPYPYPLGTRLVYIVHELFIILHLSIENFIKKINDLDSIACS
jgi:hypothetical protein